MSTKRFDAGQAKGPDKLDQRFSFSGKVRGADVLLRLVEACGYGIVCEALDGLRSAEWDKGKDVPVPESAPVPPPVPKRRKAATKKSKERKAKSTVSSEAYVITHNDM